MHRQKALKEYIASVLKTDSPEDIREVKKPRSMASPSHTQPPTSLIILRITSSKWVSILSHNGDHCTKRPTFFSSRHLYRELPQSVPEDEGWGERSSAVLERSHTIEPWLFFLFALRAFTVFFCCPCCWGVRNHLHLHLGISWIVCGGRVHQLAVRSPRV
jgi:hypothetical protein